MYFSLKERKDNVPSIEIVPRPLLEAVIDRKWVPPLRFIDVQNTKGILPPSTIFILHKWGLSLEFM